MSDRPIRESYWVIPGVFLAGEFPEGFDKFNTHSKIQSIINFGFSVFIDLTEAGEGPEPYLSALEGQSYYRFPVRDGSVPDSPEHTAEILDTIDENISKGKKVYLHCWGGVGRTGLIVGCWLSRHGLRGEEALNRLHHLWQQRFETEKRETPETIEQVEYILNWNEK